MEKNICHVSWNLPGKKTGGICHRFLFYDDRKSIQDFLGGLLRRGADATW